jgi:hypothetical protein
MPITTENGLIAALVNGQKYQVKKVSATAEGAGTWHSLWALAGFPPAGATPPAFTAGSGYVPTRTTLGAIPFANPTNDAYLGKLAITGATQGTLIVYDRLWACSGFNTTTTPGAQLVTTPGALPAGRDPNAGADVEPWFEVYGAPGATTATWTITGTDSDGNLGRTWTYTHPANAESVGQMMPPVLGGTAGGRGIRVVDSLTCSASSGTAGNLGITLVRRLAEIPITIANVGSVLDAIALGLPDVYDDACLAMMVQCSTTNTGYIAGSLVIAKD